jgi:hypothetical protein
MSNWYKTRDGYSSVASTKVEAHRCFDGFFTQGRAEWRQAGKRSAIMAIQEYLNSMRSEERATKAQVFRFLEMQFARADKDHDNQLTVEELECFVRAIARPESDER